MSAAVALRRPPILDASDRQLGDAIARGLAAELGHLERPEALGVIVGAIDCTRRTAANILDRDHLPNAMHALRLIAAFPAVRTEAGRLMAAPGAAEYAAWLAGDREWWQPEYERERQLAMARAARGEL